MDLILQQYSRRQCKAQVPVLKTGYQVKVHQRIKEGNKERVQIFEGMVIRTGGGHGVTETFTVRKISGGIGVEKVFPIHAPSIEKIEVLRAHKVRRAKLHYLRERSGKALRLPEVALELEYKNFEAPQTEAEDDAKKEPTVAEAKEDSSAAEEATKKA